jgi:hypothetical protein
VSEEVQLNSAPDSELQALPDERPVPCEFRTGRAGTGKSYQLLQLTEEDPSYGVLCATTGIAAVNLGAVTINSILRYFDTLSMRDAFLSGRLTTALHKIAKSKRRILVDEASMLEDDQLDYLYRATQEANRYADIKHPLGITLIGDFAQLPPVSGKWAFRAACWKEFAANTTRLEKVWRQGSGPFLDALNHARLGEGGPAAEILTAAGMKWNTSRVVEFDGTTILCKNDMVSRHNGEVLRTRPGEVFTVRSERWGQQRSEWGENRRTHEWGIPPASEYKLGAYVMILTNSRGFTMVNGDCGYIESYDTDLQQFVIKLVRTGETVNVQRIIREVTQPDEPASWSGELLAEDEGEWHPGPHFRVKSKQYVTGQIRYFPIRLAYSSTCHKSQGLSLDKVQVDLRDRFWKSPAMVYVSLSRCRTLEGLRLVINKDSFIQQVHMDRMVLPWL